MQKTLIRKWVLGLAGWAIASSPVYADDKASVSLDQFLAAGKSHYPSLQKKPLLEQSLALAKSKINRAYWPRLSLGGQASWQSDVTSVNIPVPGVSVTPPPKDQYRATLDLQQTIWDGGAASEHKEVLAGRARIDDEKVNVEWYQVRSSILQLYFRGLVAQELVAQGEVLDAHLGEVVEQSKIALANGLLTQRDVLLAQARQLEAKAAIADAKARLRAAKRGLRELTSLAFHDGATLSPPNLQCKAPAPAEIDRPELTLLDAQSSLVRAQEKLERAGDRPRLGAFATGGYGRPGLNFLNSKFDFYFIGGVQLTVPLTHLYAGTRRNDAQQARVQLAMLARERERVLTQTKVEVDGRDSEVERLDDILAIDDEILRLREAARKQTQLQFSLGTVSMTDLIHDLTQEDQARSKREVHRAERSLACHELALISGDL